MQGRIEKNIAMAYNDTTVHSWHSVSRFHACMKICLQNATKGAPLHEQKELRSSGKHRRCAFANGAVNCSQSCGMLEWRDELYRIHQMQKEEIAWNFGKRKDGSEWDAGGRPVPFLRCECLHAGSAGIQAVNA